MKLCKKIILLCAAVSLGIVMTNTDNSLYALVYDDQGSVRGDVNSDGKFSSLDYLAFAESFILTGRALPELSAADLNNDENVDISDFVKMKKIIINEERMWTERSLPVMDGSTSAIPLEAGIRSELLGKPFYSAKSDVHHHKTHESFQMLLNGLNDLVFSVPLSDSQKKEAEKAGVHINEVPVAKEGFVFIVNKNNPVSSLTQKQIRDIYSGKITNWKEVGGNDEEIVPYQRNTDSGSQNYMIDFMGNTKLMSPPERYYIGDMGSLIGAVIDFNNTEQAIGYSVYSYAAQMYEKSSSVKFIAVDGIPPSRETLNDETYPLLSCTYAMYRDDAGQNTLDLVNWITSREGQKCVLNHGYVPVCEMEIPDYFRMYSAVGTGKKKPENFTYPLRYSAFYYTVKSDEIYTGSGYELDFIKDPELSHIINDDLTDLMNRCGKSSYIQVNAYNGYFSFKVESERLTEIKTYSITERKRVNRFSDLFYKDTEFIEKINNTIDDNLDSFSRISIRTDFLGVTGDIDNFSFNELVLENENPYFSKSVSLNYSCYQLYGDMLISEYVDLRDYFDEDRVNIREYEKGEWSTDRVKYEISDKESVVADMVTGSLVHSDEEVNVRKNVYEKIIRDFVSKHAGRESIGIYSSIDNENIQNTGARSEKRGIRGEEYVLDVLYVTNNIEFLSAYEIKALYDPETGREITLEDVFGKELRGVSCQKFEYALSEDGSGEDKVKIYNYETGEQEIKIVREHVNFRYFRKMPYSNDIRPVKPALSGIVYDDTLKTAELIKDDIPVNLNGKIISDRINAGTKVVLKNRFYDKDIYYECWSKDEKKRYGWINKKNIEIIFDDRS